MRKHHTHFGRSIKEHFEDVFVWITKHTTILLCRVWFRLLRLHRHRQERVVMSEKEWEQYVREGLADVIYDWFEKHPVPEPLKIAWCNSLAENFDMLQGKENKPKRSLAQIKESLRQQS